MEILINSYWLGHIHRMYASRFPKQLFYTQLCKGKRKYLRWDFMIRQKGIGKSGKKRTTKDGKAKWKAKHCRESLLSHGKPMNSYSHNDWLQINGVVYHTRNSRQFIKTFYTIFKEKWHRLDNVAELPQPQVMHGGHENSAGAEKGNYYLQYFTLRLPLMDGLSSFWEETIQPCK